MSDVPPELAALRASIDNLDSALVSLLAERFKITQRVGVLKATRGLPPADPDRERRQIERHLRGRSQPQIVISDERDALLETGGGVVRALPLLGHGPFVIHNSDSV